MRLDILLTKKGFAESREKAKHIIKRGYVLVDDIIIKKPSKNIKEDVKIKSIKVANKLIKYLEVIKANVLISINTKNLVPKPTLK